MLCCEHGGTSPEAAQPSEQVRLVGNGGPAPTGPPFLFGINRLTSKGVALDIQGGWVYISHIKYMVETIGGQDDW